MNKIDFIDFLKDKSGFLGYFSEAAPDAFMEALETCLQGDVDSIKQLFTVGEDELSIFGDNHATGLMWSLQKLAWRCDYFERVAKALVQLNHLDPDSNARMDPRPSSTFFGVFNTRSPQTSVDWEQRIDVLKNLPNELNSSLFSLIADVLPKDSWSVDLHSMPIFETYSQPVITNKSYYDANISMFECALARLDGDVARIIQMLECAPHMDDAIFKKAVSHMSDQAGLLTSEEQLTLWKRLRGLIVRHTAYSYTDWAMSKSRIQVLTQWRDRLSPSIHEYAKFLFSEVWIQDFDSDARSSGDKLEQARIDIVAEIIATDGQTAFLEFAKSVNIPGYLGLATAGAVNGVEALIQIVEMALDDGNLPKLFIQGCSQSAYNKFKEAWLDWVFLPETIESYPDHIVDMMSCLEIDHNISKRVGMSHFPNKLATAYWKSVKINLSPYEKAELEDIEPLLQHERHYGVLDVLSFRLEKQDDAVLKALAQGVYQSVDGLPKEDIHSDIVENILELLKLCKKRNLFPLAELAKYEVPLAKRLRWTNQHYSFAIHELATTNASTFIELLALVYKTSKPHPVQQPLLTDEEKKHQWDVGYHLLDTMRHPRLEEGYAPNGDELENWIAEVRLAAKEYGLEDIADYKIGEVLALACADEADGIWPRREVRQIIEELANERMLNGIENKQFNERGVHGDSQIYYTGLAEEFTSNSEKLGQWPKTQRFLRGIAKLDRARADDAKLRKDRYEARPRL